MQCSIHGEQDETFVCRHIVQSLEDGTPCGFWWSADSDQQRPDAWCTNCDDLVSKTGGEWTEEVLAVAQVTLLCGFCYDSAKKINWGN